VINAPVVTTNAQSGIACRLLSRTAFSVWADCQPACSSGTTSAKSARLSTIKKASSRSLLGAKFRILNESIAEASAKPAARGTAINHGAPRLCKEMLQRLDRTPAHAANIQDGTGRITSRNAITAVPPLIQSGSS
jgi:hypothetical protein